jgi:MYXO-CTERM domain-containing protein
MADADGYKAPQYYATIKFADINGDAKDDFCARFKDGFKCYLSSKNGFSETSVDLKAMSDADGWDDASRYATIRMADINGDGMADACGLSKSGWQCWPSKGDSFGDPIQGPAWSDDTWSEAMYFATIRMPDINGDHKADVCARDAKGIVCHLSTGEGWGEAIRGPELSDEKGWGKPEYYMTLQFGDLNKDGKDDLCARGADEFICYLSDGESFKRDEKYVLTEFSNAKGGNAPGVYRTIHLGDVNGDGIMDVCGRNPSKAVCFVYGGDTPKRLEGPNLNDSYGWDENPYGSTFRFGGPKPKDCSFVEEICDEKDNNCNGEVDEGGVCCVPEVCDQKDNDCDGEVDEDNVCCEPSDEICDGKDNDCDGSVDEDNVCCVPEICDQKDNDCDGEIDEDNVCCEPSEEICDQKDNDCDGEVDEDDVCKKPEEEKPDKPGKPEEPNTPDESADNTPASSAEGCSIQPQGTSSHPVPWLLGFGGLLGLILYRRRRESSK